MLSIQSYVKQKGTNEIYILDESLPKWIEASRSMHIEVNINIMRAFVHMRQYLLSHAPKQELEELRKRIEYLEEDISSDRESYEKQFDDLFTAFAKLSAAIQIKQTPLDRVKIEGFKTNNKEKSNE